MENKNWIVRVYDDADEIIDEWIIKDRFEWEAEKEAFSRINSNPKYADWTMIPTEI